MQHTYLRGGLLALIVGGGLATATASQITFESLPGSNTSFNTGNEYRLNWDALRLANPTAPAGFGNAAINLWDWNGVPPVPGVHAYNAGLIPGGQSSNLAYHYRVDLWIDPSEAGPFSARFAPDFGYGGVALLDGVAMDFSNEDLWWGGSWGATSELLEFSANLATGHHVIDLYGQEPCCDGPSAGQYSLGTRTWVPFSSNDELNPTSVPESVGILSCAGALFALGYIRHRMTASR